MVNKLFKKIHLSPERKALIARITGVALFLFAIFTLISSVSYMFTWRVDQSLLSSADKMSQSVQVSNFGGKLGYLLGHFLVADVFGLASLILISLMFWGSWVLFFHTDSKRPFRKAFLILAGTFLLSFLLTYISELLSADTYLEGGLGGFSGIAVVDWLKNLVGSFPTLLLILFVILIWGIFFSPKVIAWMDKVSDYRPKKNETVTSEAVEAAQTVEVAEDPCKAYDAAYSDELLEGQAQQDSSMDEPVLGQVANKEINNSDVSVCSDSDNSNIASPNTVSSVSPNEDSSSEATLDIIKGDGFNSQVTEELPRIDVRSELNRYEFPSLDLLNDYSDGYHEVSKEELESNNNKIRTTLLNYRIKIDKVTAIPGPTVTLYKILPAPGVKIASIRNVEEDIAISLKARGVRVVKLEDAVGIEVANKRPSIVPLKAMLNDESFRQSKAELPVAIGYTITQKVKTFDLADAPHLLIAGATKQGKSVGLNVIISSLLYTKHPSELKLVFIDPKMVEFSAYKSLLKHYLAVLPTAASEEEEAENAIIKQPKQAELVLNSLCVEMDERYMMLSKAGVNNIKLYNEKYKDRRLNPNDGHKFLPYLVVVIDEYADLTMSGGPGGDAKAIARNVTNSIVRLAQKGRAAGIHVIIATQRPTVNVVTGLIKTNFPTRIAFRVVSRTDSSTILDANGAENLIGKGDMLYYAGVEMERVQCALVSMDEINKITKFIGNQTGAHQCYNTPYYLPMPETPDGESAPGSIDMSSVDPLFEDAAKMIVMNQKGSTSDLQRRLGIGYAKAGRIMDQLEAAGVVGPQEGSKPRQVMVSTFDELNELIAPFLK